MNPRARRGCPVALPLVALLLTGPADGARAAPSDVTYHGRIARILEAHCVACHRAGGSGPFPLDTYEDLSAHAGMVREVVARGTMPPWFAADPPADPETGRVHTPWANDRSLAEAEKRELLDWLAGGKPIGDPADAPVRATLRAILRFKAGRLLDEAMPTGVAVSPAMVHGGPFPATGDPRFTAVGLPASAVRFSKLLCLDRERPG